MQFPFDVQNCSIQLELPDQLCMTEEHELGHNNPSKDTNTKIITDEHFISCGKNLQDKISLPLNSSIFREAISKKDKEEREQNAHEMLNRILSDVDLILNGCVQMLEQAHPNDEWTLTEILFSKRNFEFQTYLRNGQRYRMHLLRILRT